jgi:hypothetical protein
VVTNLAHYLRLYHDHRGQLRHPVIAAAVLGCTLVAAGCGPSSSSSAAGSSSPAATGSSRAAATGSSSPAAAPQTPGQELLAATAATADLRSAATTFTESVGSAQEVISASAQEQFKPTLRLSENVNLSIAGSSQVVGVVIDRQDVWLKVAALKQETGRTWAKIPFSTLNKSSSPTAAIYKSLESLNPAQETEFLVGAKDVRVVGTQTVEGVPVTEYSGEVLPALAMTRLTPALRKALGPGLKQITGNLKFRVWVDGNGYIRKSVDTGTAAGKPYMTTVELSSVNKPVHITLPPASQTVTVPASALGSQSAGAGAS